jgi:hypothetical protein
VLERLFQLVMYPPLLQQLLLALACGGSSTSSAGSSEAGVASVSCRSTLLSILTGSQAYPAVMVLRLLVAVLLNRHISTELLSALTLLPRKRQQQLGLSPVGSSDTTTALQLEGLVQLVLSQLQQGSQPATARRSSNEGDTSMPTHHQQQQPGLQSLGHTSSGSINMLNLLTQRYLPTQLQDLVKRQSQSDSAYAAANGPAAAASATSSGSSMHNRSRSIEGLESWLVQAEGQVEDSVIPRSGSSSAFSSSAFSAMGPQLLSALLQLLQLPALPPMGLWLLGWLLHQLLPAQCAAAAVVGASSSSQQGTTPCTTPPASIAALTTGNGGSSSSSSDISIDSSNSSDLDDDDGDSRQIGASRASSVSGAAASTEGSVDASEAWALRPPGSSIATSYSAALDQAASVLSSDQQQLVQAAVAAAQHTFRSHLTGMWCEAVFPLVNMEWQTARELIQRPVLRAGADALLTGTAVWPLLAGLQQQQQQGMAAGVASTAVGSAAGSKTAWDALSVSAKAGLECYLAVQRVVALTQLQEVGPWYSSQWVGAKAQCMGLCSVCSSLAA